MPKERFIDSNEIPASRFVDVEPNKISSSRFVDEPSPDRFEDISKEDSWLKAMGKTVIGTGITTIPSTLVSLNNITDEILQIDKIKKGLGFTAPKPTNLEESIQLVENYFQPNIHSKSKQYATEIVKTVTQMGENFAIGGPAGTLPLMASEAGINKTAEALKKGHPLSTSLAAGTFQGAVEYVTEFPFLKVVFKPGTSFLKKLVTGGALDEVGELISTAAEMSITDRMLGIKHTAQEYISALIDTAIVSLGVIVGFTGLTHHSINKLEKLKKEIEENPEKAQEMLDKEVENQLNKDLIDTANSIESMWDDNTPEVLDKEGEVLPRQRIQQVIHDKVTQKYMTSKSWFNRALELEQSPNIEKRDKSLELSIEYEQETKALLDKFLKKYLESKTQFNKAIELKQKSHIDQPKIEKALELSVKREQEAKLIREKLANKSKKSKTQFNKALKLERKLKEDKSKTDEALESSIKYEQEAKVLLDKFLKKYKVSKTQFNKALKLEQKLKEDTAKIDEALDLSIKAKKETQSIRDELGYKYKESKAWFDRALEFEQRFKLDKAKVDQTKIEKALELSVKYEQEAKENLAKIKEVGGEDILKKAFGPAFQSFLIEPKVHIGDPLDEVFDKGDELTRQLFAPKKLTPKGLYQMVKVGFVDYSAPLKDKVRKFGPLGERVIIEKDLRNGVSARSLLEIREAYLRIYADLTPTQRALLDRYIIASRNIIISGRKPDFTFEDGTTGADALRYVNKLKSVLSEEEFNLLDERAQLYFKRFRAILKEARAEGLIGDSDYERMLNVGIYSPRRVIDELDPDLPEQYYRPKSKKITVKESGFESLEEGSKKYIVTDTQLLLSEAIGRLHGLIANNRAGKALYQLFKENPDNGMGRPAKLIVKKLKNGKTIAKFEKTPKGMERFSYRNKGNPDVPNINGRVDFFINSDLAESWTKAPPVIRNAWTTALHHLSGTSVLKAMATGYNPAFALTNLPMDIALVWAADYHGVYSKFLPVYVAQMARDMGYIIKQAVVNGGFKKTTEYLNYIRQGGGVDFLVPQGRLTLGGPGVFNKFLNAWGWTGETSEILTRLAYRQRAIRNGIDERKATWMARSYLDFSLGGGASKAIDTTFPYFNAGIEATRGMVRSAAIKPGLFTAKMAQVLSLSVGLYLLREFMNPDAEEEIPDYDKVNNWIIPTGKNMYYYDNRGNKKWMYVKVRKDQGQRLVAIIGENLARKALGKKVNVDQAVSAVWELIAILPSSAINPTLSAIFGYMANYDFWRKEPIWKGNNFGKVDPEAEVTRYTPAFLREFGKLTGVSPERTNYVLKQYFTSSNPMTSLAYWGFDKILGEVSEADRDMVMKEIVLKQPFINRVMNHTDPRYRFQDELEELGTKARTEKFKTNQEFDELSYEVVHGRKSLEDLKEWIKKRPVDEHKKFIRRYKEDKIMAFLPNHTWWYEIRDIPPKARALAYHARYISLSPEERKEMDTIAMKLPGVSSKLFLNELGKLRRKFKKELQKTRK